MLESSCSLAALHRLAKIESTFFGPGGEGRVPKEARLTSEELEAIFNTGSRRFADTADPLLLINVLNDTEAATLWQRIYGCVSHGSL